MISSFGVLVTLAAYLTSVGPAPADTTFSVAISGAGRNTCASWLEDRSATSDSARATNVKQVEWITGFISAVNVFAEPSGDVSRGVDQDKLLAFIDTYCRTNPDHPIWMPAANLVLKLRKEPAG